MKVTLPEPGTHTGLLAESSRPPLAWGKLLRALTQLAIAGGAAFLLWNGRIGGPEGPIFWGAVAVVVFCIGLTANNLVGAVRGNFSSSSTMRGQVLPVRLTPALGGAEHIWEFLPGGVIYSATAVPLAIMTWRLHQQGEDIVLLGIGCTVIPALLGSVLLALGLRALYLRLVGGDLVMEVDRQPVKAGSEMDLVVLYKPGRFTPEAIEVHLKCVKAGSRATTNSTRSAQPAPPNQHMLHESLLHVQQHFVMGPLGATPWQHKMTVPIPADAFPSTPDGQSSSISWYLDTIVRVQGAPDYSHNFIIQVEEDDSRSWDDEDDDEDDEAWNQAPR